MAVRYAVRVLSERVENFIWYTLSNPTWRNMKLLEDDLSPRPVFTAYQHLISLTEGLNYSNTVNLGTGINAYEFVNNRTKLLVIWTDVDQSEVIKIPSGDFQAAFDLDGNPITVNNNNVSIGFEPIYLVYGR
jgi:hypothetical protein